LQKSVSFLFQFSFVPCPCTSKQACKGSIQGKRGSAKRNTKKYGDDPFGFAPWSQCISSLLLSNLELWLCSKLQHLQASKQKKENLMLDIFIKEEW
jgi:hypothetical protein